MDSDSKNKSSSSSDLPLTFHLTQRVEPMQARLGTFAARGCPAISTPSYIANTSRGAIPHLTPELVQKHTEISAIYLGLEDCGGVKTVIEKSIHKAPIFKAIPGQEGCSVLRAFCSIPERCLTILGPRRIPTIPPRQQNTSNSIAISTSVGFANLTVKEYNTAIQSLRPDASFCVADVVQTKTISKKRMERSSDRTHAWLRDTVEGRNTKDTGDVPLLASILPLESEQQSLYVSDLKTQYRDRISGVYLHRADSVDVIPDALQSLPRLLLDDPKSPHDVLHAISLGVDLISLPFVTATSEAGVAFNFDFVQQQQPGGNRDRLPLGVDMWSIEHAIDLAPLKENCRCYTCSRHHRPYLHHLLQAKEMLAWTLLQVHNFHVIHQFFIQIRRSITRGTFRDEAESFRQIYEIEMPSQTGQGPRTRGYQMKSIGGGEPRKNAKIYGRLDEHVHKMEDSESDIKVPAGSTVTEALRDQHFAQKTREEPL